MQPKGASVLLSNLRVQGLDVRYNHIQVFEGCSEFSFCFWTVLPPLVLALFSVNSRILSSLSLVTSSEKGLLHIMSPAKAPGLSQMRPFGGHPWTKYWIQEDGRCLFGRPESHAHFAAGGCLHLLTCLTHIELSFHSVCLLPFAQVPATGFFSPISELGPQSTGDYTVLWWERFFGLRKT